MGRGGLLTVPARLMKLESRCSFVPPFTKQNKAMMCLLFFSETEKYLLSSIVTKIWSNLSNELGLGDEFDTFEWG